MADELIPTSDTVDTSPTTDGALVPADTSVSNDGVASAATAALDQATTGAPDLDTVISSIPDADDDLKTYESHPLYPQVTAQRGQLRVLSKAIRDLKPLEAYRP